MPSVAVANLALDIFHGYQPPAALNAYFVLVLLADLARAWDYWAHPNVLMVSVVSGTAALTNAIRIFWDPFRNLCRTARELRARLKTRWDSDRSLMETISMFFFFGFSDFRSRADLPEFGQAFTSHSLSDQFDLAWGRGKY